MKWRTTMVASVFASAVSAAGDCSFSVRSLGLYESTVRSTALLNLMMTILSSAPCLRCLLESTRKQTGLH